MALPYVTKREIGNIADCILNVIDTQKITNGKRIIDLHKKTLMKLFGGRIYTEYWGKRNKKVYRIAFARYEGVPLEGIITPSYLEINVKVRGKLEPYEVISANRYREAIQRRKIEVFGGFEKKMDLLKEELKWIKGIYCCY